MCRSSMSCLCRQFALTGMFLLGASAASARTCWIGGEAFRTESGWKTMGSTLVSKGAARADCQIELPDGRFAVWICFQGKVRLGLDAQTFELAQTGFAQWQLAGRITRRSGPVTVSMATAEGAEFHGLVFSSVAGFAPVVAPPPRSRSDGLCLSLDFDESAPSACRDAASGAELRTATPVERTRGPWGGALHCPRSGIRIENSPTFQNAVEALTTEAWIRPDAIGSYQAILFKGQRAAEIDAVHFHFGLADGKPEFKFKDAENVWRGLYRGTRYPLPVVPLGRWSHVAATFDKGKVCLYLDGRRAASAQTQPERLLPNVLPLGIGEGQAPGGGRAFEMSGLIDDVKIYDRALDPEQIAKEYQAGRGRHSESAVVAAAPDTQPVPRLDQKLPLVERYEKAIPKDTIGRGPTTAAVRPYQGVPALYINDKPVFPMAMIPIGHFPTDVCRDFAGAGVHLYSHIIWGWPPGAVTKDSEWWLGPGQYDWAKFDRQIQSIIEADPQAYIFLRLKLNAPMWWVKAHPDELSRTHDGPPGRQYSLASEEWEKLYEGMLRDQIRHIEAGPYAGHIIGYQPAGGDASEWYWFEHEKGLIDYSPAARRRFRKWLARRYGNDVQSLRRAWNDRQVTFESAAPPTPEARKATEHLFFRDAKQACPVIDFQRFLTDITVDQILKSCRICKEETRGQKITGVFYGYSFHYWPSRSELWNLGFLGLGRVLDSPQVDFLCSPTDYGLRRGGEPGNFVSAYTDSYHLHGKLYWDEADLRTHHYRGNEPYATRSLPETLAVIDRGFGYMLTKGTALWWFTLVGDHTFHQQEIMDRIARLQRAGEELMPQPKDHVRDVAVLADEETFFHLRMGSNALTRPLSRQLHKKLATMGAPFDLYLLSDVAHADMPDYKLYLFLNPYYLSDELRAAIKAKVRRNGAVAVWFYAPGFARPDGTRSDDHVTDLTGIRVRHADEERRLRPVLTNFAHPITAELDRSDVFERSEPIGPAFWADDPEATVLARLESDGQPAIAVRDFGSWRSVYCASPAMTTGLLRGLVRYSGGHMYSTSDDVFYANRRFAMLHTVTRGPKEILLPEPCHVYNVLDGSEVARNAKVIRAELPAATTRIYRLEKPR